MLFRYRRLSNSWILNNLALGKILWTFGLPHIQNTKCLIRLSVSNRQTKRRVQTMRAFLYLFYFIPWYISYEPNSLNHSQCIYFNYIFQTSQIIYCKLSCWHPIKIYFLSHKSLISLNSSKHIKYISQPK